MARATIHIEMNDGETLAGAINQLFGAKAPKAEPQHDEAPTANTTFTTVAEVVKAAEAAAEPAKKRGGRPPKGEQKPDAPAVEVVAEKPVPEPELPIGGKVEPAPAGEPAKALTVEDIRDLLQQVSRATDVNRARAIITRFKKIDGEPVAKVSEIDPADYDNFAAKCRAVLAEKAS